MKKIRYITIFVQHLLTSIGTSWLILQILKHFINSFNCSGWEFLFVSIVIGVIYYFVDGYCIKGYLKNKVTININSGRNKINIFFGDLFIQKGWKCISVNEFFDNIVDNKHVARASLHGYVLEKYWKDNSEKWYSDVMSDLNDNDNAFNNVDRNSGNKLKFEIGTTAKIILGADKFLFVALSHTDVKTLEAKSSIDDFQKALKGLFTRAKSCCSGETLNIPLLGGGLSRTGLSYHMIINILILHLKEITKIGDITSEINIVLDKKLQSSIDILNIKNTWR